VGACSAVAQRRVRGAAEPVPGRARPAVRARVVGTCVAWQVSQLGNAELLEYNKVVHETFRQHTTAGVQELIQWLTGGRLNRLLHC
jgi:hypothetical protein